MNYTKEYKDCLKYIDDYWDKVTHEPTKELINKHVVTIPHPFVTPNPKWIQKQSYVFYWDTFFIFRGLIRTKREWLLKSMVDNFIYLYTAHGIIPNFNSPASMGRSQPPFLTSMILDTYNGYYFAHLGKNRFVKLFSNFQRYKKWLQKAVDVAQNEYEHVWIDKSGSFHHKVPGYILNRYGDRDIGYAHSSELESGWDFTSRFYNRCDEFLPIDLNVYLFKYERDFAKISQHLGNKKQIEMWLNKALARKTQINKLMWNEDEGFFYDFGYKSKRASNFLSLAGFTPLWAGLASLDQANRMVKKLSKFETDYGLVITAKESLAPKISISRIPARYRPAIKAVLSPKQWDYPNAWPPLEYLTVVGLLKYGFIKDAVRIIRKSLGAQATIFRKYKTFYEKIDGVKGERASSYHYTNQSGFGWTNAVFYRYVQIVTAIENGDEIYATPRGTNPPYKLSIPH